MPLEERENHAIFLRDIKACGDFPGYTVIGSRTKGEIETAFSVRESRQVLDVIKDLRKHDVSVIVVSHNMQQLMDVADRITVMRLGRTVATRVVKETTVEEIIGLITGAIGADPDEETRLVTESAA